MARTAEHVHFKTPNRFGTFLRDLFSRSVEVSDKEAREIVRGTGVLGGRLPLRRPSA